ncbi:glycosyltransferase family 39 protein [Moorena producens JHB]|uniref:Glycosyltransferase family 39 protein n=1 Tax=Moorena producens (strain JHB) TaxID=1454205 RepID=A0A1D9G4C5_MOOP1|nr:glycosyltransferase family 39 protein [Moorena producens]AOY82468.1 glycosyltransferase family 39 protein [Moorena producens JHB]
MQFIIKTILGLYEKFSPIKRWLPILFILLTALILYHHQIDRQSLWIDELYSVRDVKTGKGFPPQNLIRPIYYLLLSVWMKFGNSDAWLRSLASFFGIGSIFLTYLISCRLMSKFEGYIAAILLTLSPLFVYHSQQVRMYSLTTFSGLLGTLFMIQVLERPSNFAMAWWAVFRLISILTLPLNVTLIFADLFLVIIKFRGQYNVVIKFAKWLLIMCVVWSPLLLLKLIPATRNFSTDPVQQSRPSPNIVNWIRFLREFVVLPPFLADNVNPDNSLIWVYRIITLSLIILVGIALVTALRKENSSKTLWVAAWGFLPVMQIFLASNLFFSIWLDRYLLFTVPYFLILLASALVKVWHRNTIIALIIIFLYGLAVFNGLSNYYRADLHRDFRGMVHMIKTHEKDDDIVVWAIESWINTLPLFHYDHGSAEIVVAPRPPSSRTKLKEGSMEDWFEELPATKSRLWLLCKLNSKNEEVFNNIVTQMYQIQAHQRFKDQNGKLNYHVFLVLPTHHQG